jgi:hypothetical protein
MRFARVPLAHRILRNCINPFTAEAQRTQRERRNFPMPLALPRPLFSFPGTSLGTPTVEALPPLSWSNKATLTRSYLP